MANTELGQIVGHARSLVDGDVSYQARIAKETLRYVETPVDVYGEPYPESIVAEYEHMLELTKEVPVGEASRELSRFLEWAKIDDKNRPKLDFNKPENRLAVAKALRGLHNLATGLSGEENRVTPLDQMGKRQRQLHFRRLEQEARESFGLLGDYNSDYFLSLVGDVAAISPHEMGMISSLVKRKRSSFAAHEGDPFVENRVTDEVGIVLKAFVSAEGREGASTYSSLMALSDISKMNIETYKGLLKQITPNEVFFLAHLPFVVRGKVFNDDGSPSIAQDGSQRTRGIQTSVAEVFEWLLTPEGREAFRETPYQAEKFGLNGYIGWLEKKYPNASAGLDITSNFSVASEEPGEDWKRAGVLSGGELNVKDLKKPYVEMATDTWLQFLSLARGMVNVLVPRNVMYREGNIGLIGTEMQKMANTLPFYYENYAMYDYWLRNTFPRFRSLSEYFTPDPMDWLIKYKKLQPDLYDPFHPRDWSERSGGVSIDYSGLNEAQRHELNVRLVDLFFAVEEDPGDGIIEAAVEELYRGKNGRYYDSNGILQDDASLKKTDAELIDLALEWNARLRTSLNGNSNLKDEQLQTLMDYRTFYILPADVIRAKINHLTQDGKNDLSRVNFEGLARRFGPLNPMADYQGASGALEVTKLLRSGYLTRPAWGVRNQNDPEKHGGYEERMVEVYKELEASNKAGIQSRTSNVDEAVGESLEGSKHMDTLVIKELDKIFNRAQGIQADVSLRKEAIKELLDHYGKLLQTVGFMSKMRGVRFVFKYGEEVVKSMFGYANSYQYISSGRNYYESKNEVKRDKPVSYGDGSAKYGDLYKEAPEEALKILGIYLDKGEPVYLGKAGRITPIAVQEDGRKLVPVKINVSRWYNSQRPIVFQSPKKSVETVVESLWNMILDTKLQSSDEKTYFMSLDRNGNYTLGTDASN